MAGALPLHDIHDAPFPAILADEDDPALRRACPGHGQQMAQPFRQKRQACPAQFRMAGTTMRTGEDRPILVHEDISFLPVIPYGCSRKWKFCLQPVFPRKRRSFPRAARALPSFCRLFTLSPLLMHLSFHPKTGMEWHEYLAFYGDSPLAGIILASHHPIRP